MALVYQVTMDGRDVDGAGSLAMAAEYARRAARGRPGAIACVDNLQGERVAEYVIDANGDLRAWVR